MTGHATDILQYEHDLKAAGVPDNQAEIHANKFAQIIDDKLVTKEYLNNRLLQLETQLESTLTKLEGRLINKVGGIVLAGLTVLFMLLKWH